MSASWLVEAIGADVARAVIEAKHYKRKLGIFWAGFGLYESGSLIGVVCYGQPSPPIQRHAFRERDFRLYELTRLVIDGGTKNAASYLISRSLKMLPSQPCAVISYADSAAGHAGIVYQATNWIYTGPVKAHDKLYVVDGKPLHPMTIRDRFGITEPAKWAKENGIKSVAPQPKHRYFFFVGSRSWRRQAAKKLAYKIHDSYPKADQSRYDDGPECEACISSGQGVLAL